MNIQKRNELILYAVILTAALVSYAFSAYFQSAELIIAESGVSRIVMDPGKDAVYKIKGELGETLIEVKQRKFCIQKSPCPGQICVHQGWTGSGSIICIPQKIRVYTTEENVDAVSW